MENRRAKFGAAFLGTAVLTLGLGTASASEDPAAAGLRIGTVDMQRALQTVEAGKKAKGQLEKDFNSKKKELQDEEAAIKKMGEEFRKQALVMSDEAKMKKETELRERIIKFQEKTQKSQLDIQGKERELTAPIITKLRSFIADTAKKRGYTLVLEKNENTVLFSMEKDDLTEEVITLFNKDGKT